MAESAKSCLKRKLNQKNLLAFAGLVLVSFTTAFLNLARRLITADGYCQILQTMMVNRSRPLLLQDNARQHIAHNRRLPN
ncbi:jg16625 [Pararge aegeria aegeria]|uniref:Jg16625 protein n=1 Tax=Pararge aegeria aegeria TaxID=348720 RepID=A0A8S4R813_9NEOP|nr:jg16625 [Pararge aegeria aegeria]